MLIAVILLCIAVVVLSAALILQKREIRKICDALTKIRDGRSGGTIHSSGGSRDTDRLISEINDLIADLRLQKEEYERKRHQTDQMVTNISHDLRTPLTSAVGYVDLIRSGTLDKEEERRELEIVSERLDRLQRLIDSFFEFSKVLSEGGTPEITKVNVTAVLEESIACAYDNFEEQGRSIIPDIGEKKITASANPIMLTRIFDNLISNALKHGKGDLNIIRDGTSLVFSNGLPGEEPVDTDRIFDEFYTTDISRTKGSTGLGLAIAKQFSDMLGIGISASCESGSFSIRLDLKDIIDGI